MKITQVEYSKTFNLGNYQSAKIGFVVQTEEDENRIIVMNTLKTMVEEEFERLHGKPSR